MSIKSRIDQLERKAGVEQHQGPEILTICLVRKAEDGSLISRPHHAIFIGFASERLHAEEGETCEQFGIRAQARMAELKQTNETTQQNGN